MPEPVKEQKVPLTGFFQTARRFMRAPDNQFSHAYSMIQNQGTQIKQDSDPSELRDPNAFLGFIDHDQLIRLYQNDAIILENLFAIAKKSKPVMEVFATLFNGWIFEIRLTGNKSGIERKMQYSFGQGIQGEGLGSYLQKMEEKRLKDEYERQQKSQIPGGSF
jgi:hypothetical protein